MIMNYISSLKAGETQESQNLIFAIIGDSISAGRGEVAGPTPIIGTVKEWDGVAAVNITDADVSTVYQSVNPYYGSPWPQFGIDLNANTNKTVILSCSGQGGSEWWPNGDTSNWYPSGILYEAARTKLYSALLEFNKVKPDGILIILGINDARAGTSMTSIKAGMDSLISRLNADFNTPNIYIAQIGRAETGDTNRVLDVRKLIDNTDELYTFYDGGQYGLGLVQRYNNVFMAYADMPNFTALGYMRTDNLHPNQEGNNVMGAGFADFVTNNL